MKLVVLVFLGCLSLCAGFVVLPEYDYEEVELDLTLDLDLDLEEGCGVDEGLQFWDIWAIIKKLHKLSEY